MVVYFKQLSLVIISIIFAIISFCVSMLLHPYIYRDEASDFSRLRGGPAVGVSLAFINSFANLEALRVQAKGRCLSTNDFILALTLSMLSAAAGVLGADMFRGWNKKGE